MTEFHFSLIVPASRMTDEQILDIADVLAAAGCIDASTRGHAAGMELLFDRQGDSLQSAICQRFPKAALLCDTASHLILGIGTGRGPGSDMPYFRPVLESALKIVPIDVLAADAGFDAEHTHEYARHELGVRTLIPPTTGHPTKNKPKGYWRRKMAERLHLTRYTQRWQIETVNRMFKRLQGSALRARKAWSQYRELTLRAITHNILLLWILRGFDRATADLLGRAPIFHSTNIRKPPGPHIHGGGCDRAKGRATFAVCRQLLILW